MRINIEISDDEFEDAFNWFFVPYRLLWNNYFDYLNEKVDARSEHVKVDMDLLEKCKGD